MLTESETTLLDSKESEIFLVEKPELDISTINDTHAPSNVYGGQNIIVPLDIPALLRQQRARAQKKNAK